MAITRAQQAKQMLQDGGMLVKPGNGKRPGYRESKAQEGRRGVTSSPPKSVFTGNEDRQQYSATQTQTGKVKGGGPKQYESDGSSRFLDSKVDTDRARRAQAEFLLDTARGLSELRKRGVTQIPPGFPGSSVLNMLTPFRNFSLRKNIDYFRGLKSRNKNLGIQNYPETEQGYRDYMRDRLAGKIDAAGNLKAGFMRGPDGTIMPTGNDGRDDAIIPVIAEAMKEEDTKDDLSNIFARFGINPRIAGSIFEDEDEDEDNTEFAADGGRIGYRMGGGPIKSFFEFLNKKNPVQAYTDYLKSIKDKTLKANKTGKFTDLPIAEVGIPATGGAFINRAVKKRLQAENEKYERKQERDDKADGGMLVSPSKDGKRPGYRSAQTQEAKQQSAREYKASTTQQQRDDDRREFQEQRKQAVQRLEEAKPTSRRRRGIENAVRTASELNYLRNLYKLDPVGLGLSFVGNKVSDFFFPPAGAADFKSMTPKEIEQLFKDAGIETDDKTLKKLGVEAGAVPEPVDLGDPFVSGPIAKIAGLGTGLKKVDGKQISVPYDSALDTLKQIQDIKYSGKPIDEAREEVIRKASDFEFDTFIDPKKAGAAFDLVELDQPVVGDFPIMAAEGGIMDLGRQELFLGGIAKGLKKAARGVSRTLKKVAKSPIGKAALIGALGYGLGGGTFFGKMLPGVTRGGQGIGGFGGLDAILGNVGDIIGGKALGDKFVGNKALLGILAASGIAGAMTPKEEDGEDEFLRQYYNMRLDPSLSVRGTGGDLNFDFYGAKTQFVADGGRIGAQEGGIMPRLNELSGNVSSAELMLQDINERLQSAESSLGGGGMQQSVGQLQAVQAGGNSLFAGRPVLGMQGQPAQISPVPIRGGGAMLRMMGGSGVAAAGYAEGGDVEPVAKKTMPLLDLKGQEMDLRAEGGFVPIGRMEKADDVPARLSKNEFVFTADAVRNAGDGDVDKGAEVMYNMMKNLERGGNVSDESQGLEGARKMFQTSKRLEEVL